MNQRARACVLSCSLSKMIGVQKHHYSILFPSIIILIMCWSSHNVSGQCIKYIGSWADTAHGLSDWFMCCANSLSPSQTNKQSSKLWTAIKQVMNSIQLFQNTMLFVENLSGVLCDMRQLGLAIEWIEYQDILPGYSYLNSDLHWELNT